ncbi:hypothetical protein SAMN05518800_3629 [Variovorax sp. YR752]|nr:hypothetical protein SAMN05518800_3629 [Variovorax sp. YR752]
MLRQDGLPITRPGEESGLPSNARTRVIDGGHASSNEDRTIGKHAEFSERLEVLELTVDTLLNPADHVLDRFRRKRRLAGGPYTRTERCAHGDFTGRSHTQIVEHCRHGLRAAAADGGPIFASTYEALVDAAERAVRKWMCVGLLSQEGKAAAIRRPFSAIWNIVAMITLPPMEGVESTRRSARTRPPRTRTLISSISSSEKVLAGNAPSTRRCSNSMGMGLPPKPPALTVCYAG